MGSADSSMSKRLAWCGATMPRATFPAPTKANAPGAWRRKYAKSSAAAIGSGSTTFPTPTTIAAWRRTRSTAAASLTTAG